MENLIIENPKLRGIIVTSPDDFDYEKDETNPTRADEFRKIRKCELQEITNKGVDPKTGLSAILFQIEQAFLNSINFDINIKEEELTEMVNHILNAQS